MQSRGLKANGFVVAAILSACSQSAEMAGRGAQIHGLICKTGLMRDVFVGTALLHLYGSCGLVADVERLFPRSRRRTSSLGPPSCCSLKEWAPRESHEGLSADAGGNSRQ
ncbi:unnamed protein product [Spirodela intermedia]|uniref:Uncharacterized protein n=1 Tax=Spirodela intermedia TaxID=51605 RepID=A0A7I8JJD6_SPIIN|nr:unnamed protein product [Spirodela intermedia]CAA6669895.1 unnamed protein product [Spirodela intermedia]